MRPVYRSLDSDKKQKIWIIHDSALILPEYIVEFDYMTLDDQEKIDSAFANDTHFSQEDIDVAELNCLKPVINYNLL